MVYKRNTVGYTVGLGKVYRRLRYLTTTHKALRSFLSLRVGIRLGKLSISRENTAKGVRGSSRYCGDEQRNGREAGAKGLLVPCIDIGFGKRKQQGNETT